MSGWLISSPVIGLEAQFCIKIKHAVDKPKIKIYDLGASDLVFKISKKGVDKIKPAGVELKYPWPGDKQ